jgi:hypothetical protein
MDNRTLLAGVGLGAALAFVLDPDRGARRRARARDKMAWAVRNTRDGLDATARDLPNRARGMAASTQSHWAPATRALVSMTAIVASGLLISAYARR